jgi:hypothetical protein
LVVLGAQLLQHFLDFHEIDCRISMWAGIGADTESETTLPVQRI